MAELDLKGTSPIGRFSYPAVYHQPVWREPDGKEKIGNYEVTLLFPKKSADLSSLRKAADAMVAEHHKGVPASKVSYPIKNGDVEKPDNPEFAGMYYVKFSTKNPPGVFVKNPDKTLTALSEESGRFYGGCYGCVSWKARSWNWAGKRGVGFWLNNVLKTADGERFGGRTDPHEDFDAVTEPEASADDLFGEDSPF